MKIVYFSSLFVFAFIIMSHGGLLMKQKWRFMMKSEKKESLLKN